MTKRLTAIIEREGSQGNTVDEARANLQEALQLFFETASKEEIRDRLHGEIYVTQVEVALG